MALHRAWRFLHPDFDLAEGGPGLALSSSGSILMVEDRDTVRQSLLLLLSTIPGERIMRPDYGCHLHRLVFSPNDDTTAGLAIHYVRSAVERWEPRAEVIALDATRNPDDGGRLDISLDYQVRTTGERDELRLGMQLTE